MTIKRQFQLYVTALVLVPSIVALLLGGGFLAFSEESEEIHKAMEQRRWVDEVVRPAIEADAFGGIETRKRFHVVVGGPDGTIVLSTVPSAPVGAPFEPPRRPPDAQENVPPLPDSGLSIIIEAVQTDRGLYRIVQAFPSLTREDLFERSRRVFIVAVAFFGLLFLGAIGGIVSVSSLQRDLLALQRATRRISSGDLDFTIEPNPKRRVGKAGPAFPRRRRVEPNEIDQLTIDLDAMREHLKEEQARRSRFLMAVSHDLATPLTTIRGYIEAMQDGLISTDEERHRSLGALRNKTDLLESRIVELIEFVRLETGEWRMANEKFSLKAFLTEVAAGFSQDADVARRSFHSYIDLPEETAVQGDRRLLMRVFENLFHNALRFTAEGDELALSARPERGADGEESIRIEFKDTGPGFAEADPNHLLEPFARGSHARNEPGFGLGLSTAASIVRHHDWEITLENAADGGGAVVSILIPPSD